MRKAGIVVQSIFLICSKSETPTVSDARLVVSESGDILSPRKAPEMTAPAVMASDKSKAPAIPIKATPIVADVVNELPIHKPKSDVIKKATAKNDSPEIQLNP